MNWRPCLTMSLLWLALSGPASAEIAPPIGDVMAGEFALQQGDLATAARYYLLAAQVSNEPGLAERAARIALLADDARLARRALARWQALAPDSRAMQAASVDLALREGEQEQAADAARLLLSEGGAEGFTALTGALSGARGDAAVIARSVLAQMFTEDRLPDDLSSWLAFAGLARRLDDRPLSDRIVDAGLARFPDDPRAQLLDASRLREEGRDEAARAILARVAALPDLAPELLRATAGEWALIGEPATAAAVLARAPQNDATYGQRAAWLLLAEDSDGLQALYDEIGRVDAPDANRRLLLGHIAEALQRWSDAERWYRGVPRGRGHDTAQLRLASVLDRLARRDEALDVLHELQADRTADGERVRDSYLMESELLDRGGPADATLAALARGLAVFEDDPVLLYTRAMRLERAGRVESALADLRRILDDNPEDAMALNAYGYTLADRRQRYADALPYLERAYALTPDSAAILDSLGWVHFRLGRHERGLVLLQQAWDLQRDAEIAAHLGEALWQADRKDEARAVWQAGQALDADNAALRRALETFVP